MASLISFGYKICCPDLKNMELSYSKIYLEIVVDESKCWRELESIKNFMLVLPY